jgi:beta-glucosidase
LYLSHKNTAFKNPIRALKGFQRIHLKAGETQNLTFTLSERDLSEIDASGKSVAMKGEVEISVGGGQVSKGNVVGKFLVR